MSLIQGIWASGLGFILITAPRAFLSSLGWTCVDPILSRLEAVSYILVAAASLHTATAVRVIATTPDEEETGSTFSIMLEDTTDNSRFDKRFSKKCKNTVFVFMFFHLVNGAVLLSSIATHDGGGEIAPQTPALITGTIISFFLAMFWAYVVGSTASVSEDRRRSL